MKYCTICEWTSDADGSHSEHELGTQAIEHYVTTGHRVQSTNGIADPTSDRSERPAGAQTPTVRAEQDCPDQTHL